jgi:hypothetical protein
MRATKVLNVQVGYARTSASLEKRPVVDSEAARRILHIQNERKVMNDKFDELAKNIGHTPGSAEEIRNLSRRHRTCHPGAAEQSLCREALQLPQDW